MTELKHAPGEETGAHPAQNQPEVGWRFLLTPRWFGYYALIVVFSIACVFLGNWQFDRRAEARAEIARLDLNYDAQPVPLAEAMPRSDQFDVDKNKWRQVSVSGEYVSEPFLARNRVSASGVGSLLIQPLLMDDGTYFFVDRGWVEVDATDSANLTKLPAEPTGPVEVVVRLRESETALKGRENFENTLGSLDMGVLADQMGVDAYTAAYGQLVSETPAGQTGLLPPKPERDEGPHLSYALQWYVFILIVVTGAWYAASLEYKSVNGRAPGSVKKLKRQQERAKRRPLSDAEEEDAFLDGQ